MHLLLVEDDPMNQDIACELLKETGLLPALVMVAFLLVFGGYLRRGATPAVERPKADLRRALPIGGSLDTRGARELVGADAARPLVQQTRYQLEWSR